MHDQLAGWLENVLYSPRALVRPSSQTAFVVELVGDVTHNHWDCWRIFKETRICLDFISTQIIQQLGVSLFRGTMNAWMAIVMLI